MHAAQLPPGITTCSCINRPTKLTYILNKTPSRIRKILCERDGYGELDILDIRVRQEHVREWYLCVIYVLI